MSAQAWSTLRAEVKGRIRLAVLDVVCTAPPGQFWTAYGLQRHARLPRRGLAAFRARSAAYLARRSA